MVQDTLALRVGRVVELEAAVETESVDYIRAHAAADRVGSLEDCHGHAEGLQAPRSGEAAQPCAHHDHGHDAHGIRLWITQGMRLPSEGTMPA